MATTDSELITEVRALTDYPSDVMSDAEVQELIDIGKEELRAQFSNPSYTFYTGDQSADRALFWFTCLGTKIKAGEIGSVNLEVGDILAQKPAQGHYDIWFESFESRVKEAESEVGDVAGPAQTELERDNRTYEL